MDFQIAEYLNRNSLVETIAGDFNIVLLVELTLVLTLKVIKLFEAQVSFHIR